jgi:hypothetical protein
MDDEMDRWWGMDEDSYLDEDGKPISKEDYYKQFKGGMINPFDKDGNLLPQFQRDPMVDDSMFHPEFDWVENERRTTNPFYHLQGGDDDYDWQGLVGRVGTALQDSVEDMFLSPEEIEKKRLKKEACKLCHEGEETVGGASPFYHLRGSGKLDEMTVRQLIDYGKSLGVKGLDGKTKAVIIDKIEKHIPKASSAPATAPAPVEDMYAEEREHAYKLLIEQPLKVLKGMAVDFKITRIPHKNKETLAKELADKYVEEEVEKMEAEKKVRKGNWTGDTDPNGEPVIKMGHYIRRPKPHELAQGFADPPSAMAKQYRQMEGKGKEPVLPPQDALESKKDNPVVEEIIEEPMDDGDIRAYFPNAKIIRYSSLAKMSDIEQLLPRDKTYAFLLYEDSPGSGHWVVVLRYGTTIEFFCSYGSKIDGPLRWYNPKDNVMLGQNKPYLSLLLKKADKKFKAIHNAVPFQSSKHGVATCGAWDVMRVNQLVNHNQDLHEFQSYMEDVKKETGLTYDEIVANYVSKR